MMRLQRYLSQCGKASRRNAEQYILDGRVAVNGNVVRDLGTKVDARHDRVTVDGQHVLPERPVVIVLHKPPGTICSTDDPEGRQTVLDLVDAHGARLYPVGRLDYQTSGVLLLTNDGDLAQHLMHPRYGLERIYHVKVQGLLRPADLEPLRQGVTIDTGQTVSAKVSMLAATTKHTWIEMTIRQGINHQIHRMMSTINRRVLKLIRVEFAGIRADELKPAHFRELTRGEVDKLRKACKLPPQKHANHDASGRSRRTTRRVTSTTGTKRRSSPRTKPRSGRN